MNLATLKAGLASLPMVEQLEEPILEWEEGSQSIGIYHGFEGSFVVALGLSDTLPMIQFHEGVELKTLETLCEGVAQQLGLTRVTANPA